MNRHFISVLRVAALAGAVLQASNGLADSVCTDIDVPNTGASCPEPGSGEPGSLFTVVTVNGGDEWVYAVNLFAGTSGEGLLVDRNGDFVSTTSGVPCDPATDTTADAQFGDPDDPNDGEVTCSPTFGIGDNRIPTTITLFLTA